MFPLMLIAISLTAPMPGELEMSRFKQAFESGENAYKKGEYGVAIALFRRADHQRATAEVAYDLAKCHEKLNEPAFTVYFYRLYLRRSPGASDANEVNARVSSLLSQAASFNRGLLEFDAPLATDISVNNKFFPEGPVAIFLPPGEYEVKAKFGSAVQKTAVEIFNGQPTPIEFSPVEPPLISFDGLPAGVLATNPGPGKPVLRISSIAVAGLGIAAVVTGAIVGAMSNADLGMLNMNRTLSVSEGYALNAQANTKGLAANILMGAGGAAVVGGALMFAFSFPDPAPATKASP
jgi:hypothetical protein